MKTQLFKYQSDIVKSRKSPNIALFMDMGTGKTLTSIACYEKFATSKILTICMISKMNDWKNDLQNELNINSVILNKGHIKNNTLLTLNNNSYIINFESSWRLKELLTWVDDKTTIIVDESHKIKNPSSKVGKFFQQLGKKTNHKIILTGTPQSQGYIDYYNQLSFIDLFTISFKQFKDQYCVYNKQYYNGYPINVLTGYKNTDLLDTFIKNNCVFFERTIDEDLVPSNIIQYFDKPKMYNKFKKERVYEDVIADNTGKLFITLRTICSGNIEKYEVDNQKIQWLSDMLDCVNDRVVIFYNFNVERDRIINVLQNKNIVYNEYNGREKSFTDFKNNDYSVMVCQYKSASLGINDLVLANKCVLFSLPLDYTDYVQSKKRIDRIGQDKKPLFYYLICKGTIEEKIYEKLQQGKTFDEKMFSLYLNDTY